MENKWEYDYSGMYQNGYTPNNDGYRPMNTDPAGGPTGPISAGGPELPSQPPKKHGRGKKIGLTALMLAAVALFSFGGGYFGYAVARQHASDRVVYQSVQPSPLASSGDPTVANGWASVSKAVSPSVVVVTTDKVIMDNFWGGTRVASGAGSGVIYTSDGYIITNNHVIADASNVTVRLNDGTEYPATVVGADGQTDVAVIKIDATGLIPAVLGDSENVQIGESVIAVGNPMGTLGGTVTDGIISGLNRDITVGGYQMNLLQTSAAVSPGNSGGGLFNANGELVGIVNAKSAGEDAEGLGFAIPVNTARQVAEDLIENGYVTGRPVLGITVIDILDPQSAMKYGVNSFGVYVQSVSAGSGAENAGMKSGDRILSVGNKIVESSSDVTGALTQYAAGDVIDVQVARGQDLLTLSVTLGERAQS